MCVCVCVILYLISRYMQPAKAMIAAPPKAVSPFSSAFFPNVTSWSTGLACHSDPQIPTKERQRKRPRAPKINKLRVGWSASTSPLPAARASLLHILPRARLVPHFFHLHLALTFSSLGGGLWLFWLLCLSRLPPLGGGRPPPLCLTASRLLLRAGLSLREVGASAVGALRHGVGAACVR